MAMISVVVCTYHQEKYIEESIQSVLDQTYSDYELIVIDGGEDSVVPEIFKKLNLENNKKYRFINTSNIGLSATRNLGARRSHGKYILFLDGDDKIHPEYLEKTSKVLDEYPWIGYIYPDTLHMGMSDGFWESPEYNFYSLLENNYVVSCSLIRKSALLECGGFDEDNFNFHEDYENWINMGSKGWYGKHFPEKLFYYRIHKDSSTQSKRNTKLSQIYKFYIISKFPELYPRGWGDQVKEILSRFPENFMKFKPVEQEEWIKENNL